MLSKKYSLDFCHTILASTYGVAGSMKKHDHQKAKNSEKISKTDTNAMESRKAKTSNRTANTGTSKEANARASDRKAEKNGDAKRNEALNKRQRKGILSLKIKKPSGRNGKKKNNKKTKKKEITKQDNL